MPSRDARNWMLSEALNALARAENLQRRFFALSPNAESGPPCWEPPVDILETEREILVLVALPGVDTKQVEVRIDGNALLVRGRRMLPAEFRNATIHRLELPQGRFERRIPIPAGQYAIRTRAVDGCLELVLEKTTGDAQ
ncbi:MAG: Hsp20/alpha crystallin family protein [Rhodobacteraceae bacterium]|nr:Hsp20/alpha crystallin family protein [Paracoccaceae bacterium]